MLTKLLNIFRIPELRTKLIFTIALLCVYRIGFWVPLPGIDGATLAQTKGGGGSAFDIVANYMTMFSGGDLMGGAIFGLGIMPYISASIILQLLATVLPSLEKLRKEGEPGVRKINEWTRYLAVGVCVVQATMYVMHLRGAGSSSLYAVVIQDYMTPVMILSVVMLTAGSVFLMWLGEQIETFGIGNGISLIIAANIIARMPSAIKDVVANFSMSGSTDKLGPIQIIFLVVSFVFVVGASILLTEAQRRIPIQQAKHMRGRRVYGGSKQYLPLRVNHAGVMPIIFASTLMQLPLAGLRLLQQQMTQATPHWWAATLNFTGDLMQGGLFPYEVVYCLMIFFFSYFWNTVQFQPKEMANQLRDYGSFVMGIRPGKWTAEYLENVMARITYVGAAFLCVIALLPSLIATFLLKDHMEQQLAYQVTQFLGGTGLLIVISVMLDFVNRIEANLVMRNYGGFMDDSGGGSPAKIKRPKGGPVRGPTQPAPAAYSDDNPRGLPA